MPYFRAKAGMPAFASYARTAARACGGRPAGGWSVASAEGTPTTLPIRSDHHATAIEGEPAAMEASLRVSNMDMLTPRCGLSHLSIIVVSSASPQAGSVLMSSKDHIVFVVDDDFRMREALHELLTSEDMNVVTFGSAAEYLAFPKPELPACLVLDVQLPDINGLDLQRQIALEHHPHIVFITGHGDVPSSVRALKAGAVDFLTKPFRGADLLGAIESALAQDREALLKKGTLATLQQRFSALAPREREVLPLVVSGLLNKQAAAQLGISEVTLQIHRGKIMHKMQAESLAELVRMAGTLGISVALSRRAGA